MHNSDPTPNYCITVEAIQFSDQSFKLPPLIGTATSTSVKMLSH